MTLEMISPMIQAKTLLRTFDIVEMMVRGKKKRRRLGKLHNHSVAVRL